MLPPKLLFSSIAGRTSPLVLRELPSPLIAIELGARSLMDKVGRHNAPCSISRSRRARPSRRHRSARGKATRCDVLVSGVLRECANAAAHQVVRCRAAGFELGKLSAIEVEHE